MDWIYFYVEGDSDGLQLVPTLLKNSPIVYEQKYSKRLFEFCTACIDLCILETRPQHVMWRIEGEKRRFLRFESLYAYNSQAASDLFFENLLGILLLGFIGLQRMSNVQVLRKISCGIEMKVMRFRRALDFITSRTSNHSVSHWLQLICQIAHTPNHNRWVMIL